jgi:hypothetical protein
MSRQRDDGAIQAPVFPQGKGVPSQDGDAPAAGGSLGIRHPQVAHRRPPAVDLDVRVLLAAGERALRSDNRADARAAFLAAGQVASRHQLWRRAQRCYRLALELDLVDREPIERILRLPSRTISHAEWNVYACALDCHAWPSFGCRPARIVTGSQRSQVECPGIGAVMELTMPDDDRIEAHPDPRLAGMPFAMAMMILRRAMWIAPRDPTMHPQRLRVAFDELPQVWLCELGEWKPVDQARASAVSISAVGGACPPRQPRTVAPPGHRAAERR